MGTHASATRYRALALHAQARPACPFETLPGRLLVVDVSRQRMGLLVEGQLLSDIVISTAANGIGSEEGSYRTPPGWHRVHACLGDGEPIGRVFRSRVAQSDFWQGEPRDEDLILTRVLTLEGLEEGMNRGEGIDSLARYIYIHGTNQEDQLGQPVSHGCVRVGNADMLALFEQVREGDALVIVPEALEAGLGLGRLHFAGCAGVGMSALVQMAAGGPVSGSDRSLDRGERPVIRQRLEALGVQLFPQDGSGVRGDCAALVVSTAVEDTVPDVAEAKRLGVPILHRSDLLAHLVTRHRTLAISGTSGKSTTTAMVFELLQGTGRGPSLITGADLVSLQDAGAWGNAWRGASDLLVIEADESDGSLVRYQPEVGVVLNLQKDHKEPEVVLDFFRTFKANTRGPVVLGEEGNLDGLRDGATTFGFGERADLRGVHVALTATNSTFTVEGVRFTLPMPGRHNVSNALAALAACRAIGVPLPELVAPLAAFRGVARRFQVLGTRRGITLVDDFAHNPAKVTAALEAAHLRSGRVWAIFQPHGFGPLKFLREEFVEAFVAGLGIEDRLSFLEVFYPGGTAAMDICSGDVIAQIAARGVRAEVAATREGLVEQIAAEAQPGDLVLLMGARDPSLGDLAQSIYERL